MDRVKVLPPTGRFRISLISSHYFTVICSGWDLDGSYSTNENVKMDLADLIGS